MLDKVIKFFITLTLTISGGAALHQVSPFLISYINLEFFQVNTGIFRLTMANLLCILAGASIGGLAGFFVSPYLIGKLGKFTSFVEKQLNKMPINDVIAGAIGLAIGLILANLLGNAFSRIPIVGNYIPIIFSLVLGYLGVRITIKKRKELTSSLDFIPHMIKDVLKNREAAKNEKESEKVAPEPVKVEEKPVQEEILPVEPPSKVNLIKIKKRDDKNYKLLDTNVIIDGRIADICKTGFLEGETVIPGFVLDELRHIADSADDLRRARGRRGLDVLQKMQEDFGCPVRVMERDENKDDEVDVRLLKLARKIGGAVMTNDYNLNKVAGVTGVPVLNINDLAGALRPQVLPGEEMTVHILREGKEPGQGVAYLNDGTMVVIENGRRKVGETVEAEVTTVLQTSAGRMIFARAKANETKAG